MYSRTALRFKITMLEIRPPIWRRIEMPAGCTFWDLHCAIQDAMGWDDTHLHEFRRGPARPLRAYPPDREKIGIPFDDGFEEELGETRAGWLTRVSRHFRKPGDSLLYIYDFGDYWHHRVVLEAKERRPAGISAPACLGGRRACPPEDCGGVSGYESIVSFIAGDLDESERIYDPEVYEYYRDHFDPARFDPEAVVFTDPGERLRLLLSDEPEPEEDAGASETQTAGPRSPAPPPAAPNIPIPDGTGSSPRPSDGVSPAFRRCGGFSRPRRPWARFPRPKP